MANPKEDGRFDTDYEDDDENSLDIEVVDEGETPQVDTEKLEADEKSVDEEIGDVSDNVRKRIERLTWQRNEERRQREEAERVRQEAVSVAQQLLQRNQLLENQVTGTVTGWASDQKARYEAELKTAENDYRAAYETGDTDKMLDAQKRLARAQNHLDRVEQETARAHRAAEQAKRQPQQQQPAPQQNRLPEHAQPPDPKLLAWTAENGDWFMKDKKMTGYAFGLHEELVLNEKLDPREDEYWDQLNARLRDSFPDYFAGRGNEPSRRGPNTGARPANKSRSNVAPAKRSAGAPRKVTLTASQVDLARRLGLSTKQYAEQLIKEQQNG